jgi:hypothetical protein
LRVINGLNFAMLELVHGLPQRVGERGPMAVDLAQNSVATALDALHEIKVESVWAIGPLAAVTWTLCM